MLTHALDLHVLALLEHALASYFATHVLVPIAEQPRSGGPLPATRGTRRFGALLSIAHVVRSRGRDAQP